MPARSAPALALGATLLLALAPEAQARTWERLGSRTVEPRAALDRIILAEPERYRAIRLCAGRRAVRVYDLDVRHANGRRYDVRTPNMVPAYCCNRSLSLPTRRSALVAVSFRSQAAGPGRGNSSLRVDAR
jgi:hypothetical protein